MSLVASSVGQTRCCALTEATSIGWVLTRTGHSVITRENFAMSDRQRRLIGLLLLVVGLGIASSQALLASCSGSPVAGSATTAAR